MAGSSHIVHGIDHVQLAMPDGREEEAVAFFVGVLGFEQLVKPPILAARGGCWFRSGGAEVHLGVEWPFAPARKAHVALRISGFDALCHRLEEAGVVVEANDEIPGVRRAHTADPFGNRLELVSAD